MIFSKTEAKVISQLQTYYSAIKNKFQYLNEGDIVGCQERLVFYRNKSLRFLLM